MENEQILKEILEQNKIANESLKKIVRYVGNLYYLFAIILVAGLIFMANS